MSDAHQSKNNRDAHPDLRLPPIGDYTPGQSGLLKPLALPPTLYNQQIIQQIKVSDYMWDPQVDPNSTLAPIGRRARQTSQTTQLPSPMTLLNICQEPMQVVPQPTFDPYAVQRQAAEKNAKSGTLARPPLSLSLPPCSLRVPFDLLGFPRGTGICLALLDPAKFTKTSALIVEGGQSVALQASARAYVSYSLIYIKFNWPAYPKTSRIFEGSITMEYGALSHINRANLAKELADCFCKFMEMCEKEEPDPAKLQYAFGPDALTLDKLWLVALVQMSSEYFEVEIKTPVKASTF